MKKYKNLICVILVGSLFAAMTVWVWLSPAKEFSYSERRKLAQLPEITLSSFASGSFSSKFESYTQDQFLLRDSFRSLKAISAYYLFGQLDNNNIYIKDGYASQLEYPFDEASVNNAADRFEYIYRTYLEGKCNNIYLSVIPDKNYYLAQNSIYPSMDYDTLFSVICGRMDYAEYIDITDTLDITDYYKTDTHWRQEKLIEAARKLAEKMGVTLTDEYTVNTLDNPFYGVYYGQSSLPLEAETVYYLTSNTLDECIVTNHEDGTVGGIYDMDKAYGKDPYELFLSGPLSLVTIENPNADTERELIIFRDSFGSSIAPLLAEGYSKITLVDIRYLRSDYLDKFIDFNGQDVLFLYSTLVLNNSKTLH